MGIAFSVAESWLLLPGAGLFLLAVGIGLRGRRADHDFFLGGRSAGTGTVFASLLATVLGASGTTGIVALTYSRGWSAFWWLGAGSMGLCLLGLFWVVPMRRNPAVRTLPEWLGACYGLPARRLAAVLIAVMWTAVIAAQWAAAGALVRALLGCPGVFGIVLAAVPVVAYTARGGQASVLRTDRWQLPLIILAVGLALAGAFALPRTGVPGGTGRVDMFEGLTPVSWLAVMLVVGGMYVVGPDLCSRVLLAKSNKSARRGAILAGLVLLPISAAIVYVGIRIRNAGVVLASPREALPWLLTGSGVVPPLAAGFIGAGLLAAMLSSADTCLLTAATVVELDLLPPRDDAGAAPMRSARILVVIIGLVSVLIAAVNPRVIGNLLLAYAFYSGGLLVPLLLAGFPRLTECLDRRFVWGAMLAGGGTPILARVLGVTADLSVAGLIGLCVALLLIGVGAVFRRFGCTV